MVETEPAGQIDPDAFFNEGLEAGRDLAQDELYEQIEDTLADNGFNDDQIEELLYDPAPRRGRRRSRRRTVKTTVGKAHKRRHPRRSRRYDPAPSNGVKRVKRTVKSMLSGVKQFAFPVAAGGSFIMQYAARADALLASGLITKGGYGGILDAIKYDLQNFNATDAWNRVSTNATTIAVPLVGGYALKAIGSGFVKPGLERDLVQVAGNLLMGYGVGTGLKKVLDPPIITARAMTPIRTAAPQLAAPTVQPCNNCGTTATGMGWSV